MTTVADVVDVLEAAYPPELAESWDAIGMVCGDPADEPLVALNARHMAQACGIIFDGVINDTVRRLDQTPLNAAVSGAFRSIRGDAWTWSRRDSTVDIGPLNAVTMAGYAHAVYGDVVEPSIEPLVVYR